MLEELVIKGSHMLSGKVMALDFEKIIALSNQDFSRFYLELMSTYRVNGWWTEGKIPQCCECSSVISGPEQLRRYHGLSLHPDCFKKLYEKEAQEDGNEGVMHQYWLRVAGLVLDS